MNILLKTFLALTLMVCYSILAVLLVVLSTSLGWSIVITVPVMFIGAYLFGMLLGKYL